MDNQRARIFPVFSLLSIVICVGCKDPLPVYEKPSVIIETTIPFAYLDTVLYAESYELVARPDSYYVFQSPNPVPLHAFEENLSDNTLYGKVLVTGKMEITVTDQPGVERTISITENNLMSTPAYDPRDSTLRLDPKTPLWLEVPWDLRDDNGRPIYHEIPFAVASGPVGVNGRLYTGFYRVFSHPIHVRVSVQLFPQTSTFSGEQDFTLNIKGAIIY